jgi:chemotaxis protein methyltransferase CheR
LRKIFLDHQVTHSAIIASATFVMAFTFFFRDAETLELAIEQMLPAIQGQSQIDIWDAGCAHGPEPYTLAILLREKLPEDIFRKVHIHATDVDGDFAASVTGGIFPESELRRLPLGILEKYFRPLGDSFRYRLIEEIRSKISFSRHDLLSLEPFGRNYSLIACKNVLLHFNEEQRCKVLRMFHATLRAEGVLVMEHTQKMPSALGDKYRQMICHAQLYAKIASSPLTFFRKDPPASIQQPHIWKNISRGKEDNGPLEKRYDENA